MGQDQELQGTWEMNSAGWDWLSAILGQDQKFQGTWELNSAIWD